MSEMKRITYSKPNMANLRGRLGKSIIETIMNTPKPDKTKLKEEAYEIETLMIAAETVKESAVNRLYGIASNLNYENLDDVRSDRLSKYEIDEN